MEQFRRAKKVLIVDDSIDNLEIIGLYLKSYGSDADMAASGDVAISKIKNNYYDVILMDIEMPKMDGYQLMHALKSSHVTTPIIALTAHAMPEDKIKTKEAGFLDHVTKPIDFDRLAKLIEAS